MTKTWFISDLHLTLDRPEIIDKFLYFLEEVCRPDDPLYLLGDLFEYWVGDDMRCAWVDQIIHALKRRGGPLFLIHGNRDFLLGHRFLEATGCQLLPEISCIDLYGVKTLILHGDLLCTADRAYQRYRRLVNLPSVKKLFLSLPLTLRVKIAHRLQRMSRRQQSNTPSMILDVTPGVDEMVLDQYGATVLIHGHTHRPACHPLSHHRQRIVLGAWEDQPNAICCSEAARYHRIYF